MSGDGDRWISPAEMRARGYDPATVTEGERVERARGEAALLVLEIEKAFAGMPRPRITLNVARGYDDEWTLSEEREKELASWDPETDWTQVTDEAITCFEEYFTFSDAEGWRFYLPAFMCHYLREFPDCGWDAVYRACVNREHIGLLTEAQLQCVERFVELCHRHEER